MVPHGSHRTELGQTTDRNEADRRARRPPDRRVPRVRPRGMPHLRHALRDLPARILVAAVGPKATDLLRQDHAYRGGPPLRRGSTLGGTARHPLSVRCRTVEGMTAFVLVPGAWLGAWAWRDVADLLTKAGHDVASVTLTGLAERAGEADRETNL